MRNSVWALSMLVFIVGVGVTSCSKSDDATPEKKAASVSAKKGTIDVEVDDRPKKFKGKVKSVHSNNVIAGADVFLYNLGNSIVGESTTDTEGDYEIPDISGGDYLIKVMATGYTTYNDTVSVPFNDDSVVVIDDIFME